MDIEEVRKLNIGPGDMLVIRYSEEKPIHFIEQLILQFKSLLPSIKVLILSGVAEIAVVPEKAEIKKPTKTRR